MSSLGDAHGLSVVNLDSAESNRIDMHKNSMVHNILQQ